MNQSLKRKLSDYVLKKDVPYPASVKSMVLPDQLYGSTVSTWCRQFTEECQNKATTLPAQTTEPDLMKENLRLHKELEEMKKEVLFLKKAAAFFAKEID